MVKVVSVANNKMVVHHCGRTNHALKTATFKPIWTRSDPDQIMLQPNRPNGFTAFTGEFDIDALPETLVTSDINLTGSHKLPAQCHHLLHHLRDEARVN
jgi:hypothetical protein